MHVGNHYGLQLLVVFKGEAHVAERRLELDAPRLRCISRATSWQPGKVGLGLLCGFIRSHQSMRAGLGCPFASRCAAAGPPWLAKSSVLCAMSLCAHVCIVSGLSDSRLEKTSARRGTRGSARDTIARRSDEL